MLQCSKLVNCLDVTKLRYQQLIICDQIEVQDKKFSILSHFMLTDKPGPMHNEICGNITPLKPYFKTKMAKCDQFEVHIIY